MHYFTYYLLQITSTKTRIKTHSGHIEIELGSELQITSTKTRIKTLSKVCLSIRQPAPSDYIH